MDIHKPKPVHSLREFLSEIAVVVCGILIAIGLEQAVEAAHRGTEVHEAREALNEEMKDNAWTLRFGLEENKCLLVQAPAYAAWARGGPKPTPFRTFLPGFNASTWETVKSSAVPHMPLHDRLTIAGFYSTLTNAQKVVDLERSSALVLFGAAERDKLSEADAGRVLDAIAALSHMADFYRINAADLLQKASALGIKAEPLDPHNRAQLDWECRGGPEPKGGGAA